MIIIDEKEIKNGEIDDNKLINYFCDLVSKEKIEFIKNMKTFDIYDKDIPELKNEDYKDIDNKKLINILKSLILKDKDSVNKVKILKKQKIIFQKLWPHFVRNAIKDLRSKDIRDKGTLKFDLGVKKLTDYFKKFSDFEELLYGIDEYYRDHSLHVFRVYFLGEFLTREYCKGYDQIMILNKPKKIKKIKNDEKNAIWCIIALCHDLGYPLQKLDELNKKLITILKYFGTSNYNPLRYSLPLEGLILDKFILKVISSKLMEDLKVHLQSKFYTKYSNAYEKLSHGIMSCILLMKNLVFFKETDYKLIFEEGSNSKNSSIKTKEYYEQDARQFLIRREILRSIASHDNEDIYHIYMNNFPFLLIMCDELQEWSRPSSNRRLYYIYDKENREIIKIHNFNKGNINFSITLPFGKDDLYKYSEKKFRKFIRLLRSGINSDQRIFNFKISIKNKKNIQYIFNYENPFDFYKIKENKNKPYPQPQCEKFKPDGSKDLDFSLKNIIEFL